MTVYRDQQQTSVHSTETGYVALDQDRLDRLIAVSIHS